MVCIYVLQISEKMKPPPVVVNLLTKVEEIIPKWKIVPTRDVIDSAFKDHIKREEVMSRAAICSEALHVPNLKFT